MENPMKRKQFHVTKEDEKVLKDLAQSKGLSETEIVREAVREYV
ncbi:ribbon-helix-helix protein, CopG family [Lentibacillus juripiscarius]|uniref:Ribbon-helix-helix protein, CopG family n=1 Tax=Lentibacillus juripiscarius TaxID=257446 RepID=A0ABW5V391_9BACI